jgi:acyl-CoA thioesterase-2
LEELLDLEELDRDLYRAHNPRRSFTPHLYGGQVAAQALRAAAMTVPEDRHPHSLHGYYLRSGEADHPTIMRVTRDRDGRSFSARHVVALQRGEAIFTALASFHVDEESGDFPGIPLPDDVPGPDDVVERGIGNEDVMYELRPVYLEPRDNPGPWDPARRFWGRTREPVSDDRVLHACGIVYLSDISTGFAELDVPGLPRGGTSLDHAVHFHRPVRIDDWLFMELEPVSAAGARGVYRGTIHDRAGRLGATLAQENLMRPPTPSK